MQQQQLEAASGAVNMSRLHLCGQACRFSPFADDLLAVATAQLFGMAGPGALEVFRLSSPSEGLRRVPASDPSSSGPPSAASSAEVPLHPARVALLNHKEAVNEVAWSELSSQTLVGGGGGGNIVAWRLLDAGAAESVVPSGRDVGGVCLGHLKGHTRDILSLSWSCVNKRLLASAGLDGQLRIWDVQQFLALQVLQHTPQAAASYCSTSPVDAAHLASVGADGRLAIHDLRSAAAAGNRGGGAPAWSIHAHPCEALCVDWMKHRPWQLLTGAADGTVALWDLRRSSGANAAEASACRVSSTQAHQLAVRRVASHPFKATRFASCSYDMQVKIWDSDEGTTISLPPQPADAPAPAAAGAAAAAAAPTPLVKGSGWVRLHASFDHHREFILGLDWSTFTSGRIASASWDRSVCVWNADTGPGPLPVPKRPLFLGMKIANK